jgi:triacylglycerol lipase
MNLVFASGFLVPQMLGPVEYFRGLKQQYPAACFPQVPSVASIDVRAQRLASLINSSFPTGEIHIIAHSMAGLDARYVIHQNLSGLGAPGRIASLSTISTPHLGSPIADFLVGPQNPIDYVTYVSVTAVLKALGLPVGALGDLTSSFAQQFNHNNPDSPNVKYFYYAGNGLESILLTPLHTYIDFVGNSPNEKLNDGLVTVASAKCTGDPEPPWSTDHIGEVGYNLGRPPDFSSIFPHAAAYARIVQRLSAL